MTIVWMILFYTSLILLLVLLLTKSMRMRGFIDQLHTAERYADKWFHPTLPKGSEHYISFAFLGKFISFGLFVIVTILEEILHRLIHGLKSITALLLRWIDSYERKHHHPSGTTSRMAQLRSIMDNPTKKDSSQI